MVYFVSSVQCIVNGLAFVCAKVPLIPANYLCTCLLDSLWAPGQSRGWVPLSWHTCTRHPHSAKHWGSGPINRSLLQTPPRACPQRTPSRRWRGAGFLNHSIFCSIVSGSVLRHRHSAANNKESDLSGAQLRILTLLSMGLNV